MERRRVRGGGGKRIERDEDHCRKRQSIFMFESFFFHRILELLSNRRHQKRYLYPILTLRGLREGHQRLSSRIQLETVDFGVMMMWGPLMPRASRK
jgi:hypothetical protein